MRFGIGLLVGGLALDFVAHAVADVGLERTAHLATLMAMVVTLVAVAAGGLRRKGDSHALR